LNVVRGVSFALVIDGENSDPLTMVSIAMDNSDGKKIPKFVITGSIDTSRHFVLKGEFTDFHFGTDFNLKETSITVQNQVPYLQIESSVEINSKLITTNGQSSDPDLNGSPGDTISIKAKGEISRNSISISGSYQGEFSLDVGAKTVSLTNVEASFSYGASSTRASISATANIFGKPVTISFKYPEQIDSNCLSFSLSTPQTFSLGSLVNNVIPPSAMGSDDSSISNVLNSVPLPALNELFDASISNLSLSFSPNCHTLKAGATFKSKLFGSRTRIGISVTKNNPSISTDLPPWYYHIYAAPTRYWKLGDSSLVSDIGSSFPSIHTEYPVFVFSTIPNSVSVNLGDDVTVSLSVVPGLNFQTQLSLARGADLQFIQQILPDGVENDITLSGQLTRGNWSLQAAIGKPIQFSSGTLDTASVVLRSIKGHGVAIGLQGSFSVANPMQPDVI